MKNKFETLNFLGFLLIVATVFMMVFVCIDDKFWAMQIYGGFLYMYGSAKQPILDAPT